MTKKCSLLAPRSRRSFHGDDFFNYPLSSQSYPDASISCILVLAINTIFDAYTILAAFYVNRLTKEMATAIKERTIPTMDTLVKYDNPVLITTHPEKVRKDSAKVGIAACKIQTTSASVDARREIIEILNRILPPKEWEEDGQIWTQRVSSIPATRLDVTNLQEQLDMRLQQRQARETGICPVRRQLYAQCFDELIRQVTINCAERGLLLLRVRDEIKMTLAAYQTLYQSSIAFGMRKALQAEQGKENLINTVEELRLQKTELERTVAELRLKYDQSEKRSAELREAEEKKHMEEVQFLKKTNLQLKTQLEGIIAPKK